MNLCLSIFCRLTDHSSLQHMLFVHIDRLVLHKTAISSSSSISFIMFDSKALAQTPCARQIFPRLIIVYSALTMSFRPQFGAMLRSMYIYNIRFQRSILKCMLLLLLLLSKRKHKILSLLISCLQFALYEHFTEFVYIVFQCVFLRG